MSTVYRVQVDNIMRPSHKRQPWECGEPGWELDLETGYYFYFPPDAPESNLDRRRHEYELLQLVVDDIVDREIDGGIVPGLSRVGRVADSQFQAIKNSLLRLPRCLIKAVYLSGKRIKIQPGKNIEHWYHGRVLGVASDKEATIAGDGPRTGMTALHEFFHLFDSLKKYNDISRSAEWLKIWNIEKYRDGWHPLMKKEPAEMFAESAALYFYSESTRAELSLMVKNFMCELVSALTPS